MSTSVSRWRPTIHLVRDDLGLSPDSYPDETILALIQVESAGDDRARRPRSQFCGLLQMGALAGIDAGLDNRGRDTTELLLGDGEEAIRRFLIYQERYASRHCYQPSRIALLWKAGPGTVSKVNRLMARAGLSFGAAVAEGAKNIPNTEEYLRRFRVAQSEWSEWIESLTPVSTPMCGVIKGKS